jgi:hypothetical protein
MALSPLLLAERRRRGVCKKVESDPDRPLALCRGSGAALANPVPAKPLTASTYQPENLEPDRAPGLRPARMREPRKAGPLAKKCDKSLRASVNTPFDARGLLSGTIIRGTLKAPNSQLVTPISTKLQRPDGCD